MRPRILWALARKDMAEILGNKFVWMPIAVLPLILCGVVPAVLLLAAREAGGAPDPAAAPALQVALAAAPPEVRQLAVDLPAEAAMIVVLLAHVLAPMFLMIPMLLATVVGANAFAGEKERRTLEPLLYAPISDAELVAGKALAAFLPAVGAAWAAFALYVVVLNGVGWPLMGRWWFPLVAWWPLVLWVTPAIAGLGVGIAIGVSARLDTFMEANQTASTALVLVVGLMGGSAAGVLALTAPVAFAIGAVIWLLDLVVLAWAARRFTRSSQIGKV